MLTLADEIDYTTFVRPVCLWEAVNGTADIEGKEGSVRNHYNYWISKLAKRTRISIDIFPGRWLGLR